MTKEEHHHDHDCEGCRIANWLIRDKYQGKETSIKKIEADFDRLEEGEPIDYVIGWKEFLGCKIDLSYKPLIPREETEFWVGEAIKELNKFCEVASGYARNDFSKLSRVKAKEVGSRATRSNFASPLKALDLFAGSGCIGLAILKHFPDVDMTFGEKDENMVKQIKKNLKLNPVKLRHGASKIKVVQSDIFSNITGKFDLIFANPPYIPTKQKVQKSVTEWEPKEALFAGADGLTFIKKFLKQAKDHLNPDGPSTPLGASKIYLEFGQGEKLAITRLLKDFGYTQYTFHKDQFGKWRWVVIK